MNPDPPRDFAAGCCGGLRRDGPKVAAAVRGLVARPARLVTLPGARVRVGTDDSPLPQDGESPSREVEIKPFSIDPYAVTNGWFADFVAATGYQTEAERFGWSLVFKHLSPRDGSKSADGPAWWRRVEGASWKNPEGLQSGIGERVDHPVVHVSWNDAAAFAQWADARLPTEAEWEYAAQGALAAARFPWGDAEPDDQNIRPCNIWRGAFPDGHLAPETIGTMPVGSFAPNGYGLFNMSGNAWEWCADAFRIRSLARAAKHRNEIAATGNERVLKGGSYLCHRSYCYRYRIAARTGVTPNSSAGHVGFRVVFDRAASPAAR